MAVYEDVSGKPPAIISLNHGKGKVLLSGKRYVSFGWNEINNINSSLGVLIYSVINTNLIITLSCLFKPFFLHFKNNSCVCTIFDKYF